MKRVLRSRVSATYGAREKKLASAAVRQRRVADGGEVCVLEAAAR